MVERNKMKSGEMIISFLKEQKVPISEMVCYSE